MHNMNVHTKYYNLLKSGTKTIELRLYDEKRQQIKIGDEIIFTETTNPENSFQAIVTNLHNAANFDELCNTITPQQAGFAEKSELLSILEEFYSPEKQDEHGVLGIEIKLL